MPDRSNGKKKVDKKPATAPSKPTAEERAKMKAEEEETFGRRESLSRTPPPESSSGAR